MRKSVTLKKWFHVRKRSVPFLPSAAAMLCLAFSLPASADPFGGVTDNCTKGGIIIEKNFFGIAKHFIVNITDKENGGQVVLQIDAGVIPAGGQVEVKVPPPGSGIDHCDAYNDSEAVGLGGGGPGGVGAGARQGLKIEALFVDPITNQVILGSIFDFLSQTYPGEFLLLPDLWGDSNGDGSIGAGDLLYSLVDLNVYTAGGADILADINSRFFPGQEFSIINGEVADLPGMLFSTTEFTFDPSSGYHGTPYTGSGFAVTDHELFSDIPEPSTLGLLFLGLGATILSRRKLMSRMEGGS